MADHSSIEWTEATWNPITGCSVVSPGCTNCYAMRLAGTRLQHHPSRAGLTRDSKAGPVWTGEVRLNEQWLDQPLRWKRSRTIFVCAHGDLFHESVPDEWIDRVFAVMALAPQHTFQVLTKRADRMRQYMLPTCDIPILGRLPLERVHLAASEHMEGDGGFWDALKRVGNVYSLYCSVPWPLPNVWLGVSAEDQRRADERIPHLLATPAAVRWLSAEPLLGPLALHHILDHAHSSTRYVNALTGERWYPGAGSISSESGGGTHLDWLVAGGESGPGARPMHPDWARSLRDQCQAAGVPFFFKQWGEWREFDTGSPEVAEVDSDSEIADSIEAVAINPAWVNQYGDIFNSRDELPLRMPCRLIERIGKKAAGAILDGREWREMPR